MDNLTKIFCSSLPTEAIRNLIREVTNTTEHYYCYKCFSYLSSGYPEKSYICSECYEVYCTTCAPHYFKQGKREIDSKKCLKCIEDN